MKIVICMMICFSTIAQERLGAIKGVVFSTENGLAEVLVGASVIWENTSIGTVTNQEGKFSLERLPGGNQMVVSYVGYKSVTIELDSGRFYRIELEHDHLISEVEVIGQSEGIKIDRISPHRVENITEKELLKAACCTLSESFETNPSVDVSFTDAVTGTRQIQMLGLSGSYVQINRENMPHIRGLASVYGLEYVPGTWIESIQLNKGTGSVVNGFESMAGQINVELRKPENTDRLYTNLYVNEGGRVELNIHTAKPISEKWSSGVLLHTKDNRFKYDRNADGFLDNPLSKHFIGLNRWKYISGDGIEAQIGMKGTYIDSQGGQINYNPAQHHLSGEVWGMKNETRRIEGWAKLGQVFPSMPWKSYGLQMSVASHVQHSVFGLKTHDASQVALYSNFIYKSILGNTNHKFTTGFSFQLDDYDENLADLVIDYNFDRLEYVPGVFWEYEHELIKDLTILSGIRLDYHNLYGWFLTPRLHSIYNISDATTLRFTAGRGQRTANIIVENSGVLASNRSLILSADHQSLPYGFKPEISWNAGGSLLQDFYIGSGDGTFSLEFYKTYFERQVIMDYDRSPQEAHFVAVENESYANSLQAQLDYVWFVGLESRLGYRWYDVRAPYDGHRDLKPLVSQQRFFINLAYSTSTEWKFDATANWFGKKRIPRTDSNPAAYRMVNYSPSFGTVNCQITKSWSQGFEMYMGVENLFDERQESAILAPENPFGLYFDSSLVWGPIFGRNTYLGLRYRI